MRIFAIVFEKGIRFKPANGDGNNRYSEDLGPIKTARWDDENKLEFEDFQSRTTFTQLTLLIELDYKLRITFYLGS